MNWKMSTPVHAEDDDDESIVQDVPSPPQPQLTPITPSSSETVQRKKMTRSLQNPNEVHVSVHYPNGKVSILFDHEIQVSLQDLDHVELNKGGEGPKLKFALVVEKLRLREWT